MTPKGLAYDFFLKGGTNTKIESEFYLDTMTTIDLIRKTEKTTFSKKIDFFDPDQTKPPQLNFAINHNFFLKKCVILFGIC